MLIGFLTMTHTS